MQLHPFYLSLLAILLQAIFASTFLNGGAVSLATSKGSGSSRPKKATGGLVKKRSPTAKKPRGKKLLKKRKRGGKNSNSKGAAVKEDKPKFLIELLPEALVKLVLDYFNDNFYQIIVSTHNWLFKEEPVIAVDSARMYVMAVSEGIRSLNHSLKNIKVDERRCIEFGNIQWFNYWQFSSSHDGRYVSFSHNYRPSTDHREQAKRSIKWFTQSDELRDGRPTPVTLDGADFDWGVLSRDGKTLCSYNVGMNPITRVYQVKEEAGKDPVAFMKFKLDGGARAISGKGNRVIVEGKRKLNVHDISKDASKLVCQIDVADFAYIWELNEDGSEAAFAKSNQLRIVELDKIVGGKADQSAIVMVKIPKSAGWINRLVYDNGSKLHVLHDDDSVSLLDPLTKKLVLLEAPQEGQEIIRVAISPNADYIVITQKGDEGESGVDYTTTVKRKLNKNDFEDLFGCSVDKNKTAKLKGNGHEQ